LRVSIQDQPDIGHATALAAQKQTVLRKNAQITSSMRKSMLDTERLGGEVAGGFVVSATCRGAQAVARKGAQCGL